MNWCRIGIHDYEELNATKKVDDFITGCMTFLGFTLHNEDMCLMEYWEKETRYGILKIFYEDWFCTSETIQYCKPFKIVDKVCLKCGKHTKTYDLETIRCLLASAIASKLKRLEREFQAKELIKES